MDDWKWLAVDAKLKLWTGQRRYDSLIVLDHGGFSSF